MTAAAPLWLAAAVLLVTGAAAASDVRSYTIPNAFPIAIAAAFLPAAPFIAADPAVLGGHLASAALGFALGFALFVPGLMGGGDVKLFAAVALWTPLTAFAWLAASVTIAGGVLAACVLAAIRLRRAFGTAPPGSPPASKTRLPYGVAIFAGAVITTAALRI